jgi:hypothetical protein
LAKKCVSRMLISLQKSVSGKITVLGLIQHGMILSIDNSKSEPIHCLWV